MIQSISQVVNVPLHPVIATARLRVRIGVDQFKEIRVMCDSGAQANLLSEETLKQLGMAKQPVRASSNLIGIDEASIQTRGQITLDLFHRGEKRQLSTSKFVIVGNFNLYHPQASFSYLMFPSLERWELADPQYNVRGHIDGIVGVDFLSSHLLTGIRRNAFDLIAQDTVFGWIVFGGSPAEEINDEEKSDTLATINLVTAGELYGQIRKLWEIDELDDAPVMSNDDVACEALYKSTLVKCGDRYSVTLLMTPNAELGESKSMARRRLYCLENRFAKDPELRFAYTQFMDEYERLGHMRRAAPLESGAMHYYIPHHAVAIDRKFRVVFDASAKTSNGKSLNELQYVGQRLQKDLMDIVMNFRIGRIAITADICKMFRQVQVQPEFWDLQRILWRRTRQEPIREYWLTVVTYGMASSPFNAVRTLQQCAKDNATEFPRAAQVAENDFYMDDLLTSVGTESAAITLRGEVIALLLKGGFELAKWKSNCKAVMSDTNDETGKIVIEQDSTSVLGIVWNYMADEFQFKVQNRKQPEVITKRVITSEAARVYDPQGYVTPITIRAKLYIQELWRAGSDWDAPLTEELQTGWKNFYEELKLIDQIRIPRWLGTNDAVRIQIHLYCDASSKAYGTAAYVRISEEDGWSAKLLCSKSKVAPIKTVTIPRLELCAVELGCKLLRKVVAIPALTEAAVFLWTDSEIALHWLRKPVNELKMFVGNRVIKILKQVTAEQTRHIRSEENPADLLSRGVKTETLITSKLWWNGPKALRGNNENWPLWNATPTEPNCTEIEAEVKGPSVKFDYVMLTMMNEKEEIGLLEKFSSHRKACRVTAYVLRFCARSSEQIRTRNAAKSPWFKIYGDNLWKSAAASTVLIGEGEYEVPRPSVAECENALNYWTRKSQRESFPAESKLVTKKEEVSRNSQLWTLTPQMDQMGLLRIYGRLGNTELSDGQKHPIILHRGSTLARRLAEESHLLLCHGGVQMCTQFLRQKYWIIGIRILLRKVVNKCVVCTRYRQEMGNQFMADLPAIRLQSVPAFQCTGVDYAGPITLKQTRNTTTKGYIAVFVCMVYKAVHLELVSSLDAAAFIAALTRFVNLRAGSVKHIYSDNGTNFVKADKELQEAVEIWKSHDVMTHLESHNIQWHFNVPSAPHHGGLWEAAVKSTKTHLKRMGGAHLFTFEELATLLAKIAACLNSRPLTPISSDPNDLTALTPGHFLTGKSIVTPYEGYLADGPTNRLSAWQKIQKLQQDFWTRFTQEYITEQQTRNKWAKSFRQLRVGDLVLIKNEVTPPSQWLMGRVIEVYPGQDEVVRSCKVRTEKSQFVRPITRLCLLPIDTPGESASEAGFP